MSDIKKFTIEELEAEIERKKRDPAEALKPLKAPDFTPLRNMIIDGIEDAIKRQREPKDFSHYVYEMAMEAVYGKGFWEWWNKQGLGE